MPFSAPCVILDDARPGGTKLAIYRDPVSVIRADSPQEVGPALSSLERALAGGRHAAGYFSYELGYLFEPRLFARLWEKRRVPLLWFGIFESAHDITGETAETFFSRSGRAYAGPLVPDWDEAAYRARFDTIRDLIAAGDLYQVNLSFRAGFSFLGDALALYRALRAEAACAHCAYVDDGFRQILSLSPELFFELTPGGRIVSRPMKGTAARSLGEAGDAGLRAALAASPKDRAENLMIVDLIRNDLGRIATIGSVCVPAVFAVETYPTVHQMVSTVEARLRPGTGIEQILRALFPCGSVTGAPKLRAMEVIRELEESPRGAYCGAIGAFSPDGAARFNVAIRTLTISGGRGELGVGGAVVHESEARAEYEECRIKARYYERARRPVELIETLRLSPQEGGFARLDLHLARMARSAEAFAIPFDRARAIETLTTSAGTDERDLRVRLSLSEEGNFSCRAFRLETPVPGVWRYAVSGRRMASEDALLRHKTNWRDIYEDEHARAAREYGADEVVFRNERGQLTEGSRTNLFACIAGEMVTPPLNAGVLDGCLRRALIESGRCREMSFGLAELDRAEAVYLGNSLRGLIRAVRADC